jgi:hypothetical protein
LFPPCVPSRADPSGLGHAATIYSSVQGPHGVETPTNSIKVRKSIFVFKNKLFHLFILNSIVLLQGLILSNALMAQKNIEDEGCIIALNNLRSEVIELRNEGLKKDKILISLVRKIKEDEASSKAQAEAQKSEIEDLRKQLAEAKLKCAIAEGDRDASEY